MGRAAAVARAPVQALVDVGELEGRRQQAQLGGALQPLGEALVHQGQEAGAADRERGEEEAVGAGGDGAGDAGLLEGIVGDRADGRRRPATGYAGAQMTASRTCP